MEQVAGEEGCRAMQGLKKMLLVLDKGYASKRKGDEEMIRRSEKVTEGSDGDTTTYPHLRDIYPCRWSRHRCSNKVSGKSLETERVGRERGKKDERREREGGRE